MIRATSDNNHVWRDIPVFSDGLVVNQVIKGKPLDQDRIPIGEESEDLIVKGTLDGRLDHDHLVERHGGWK